MTEGIQIALIVVSIILIVAPLMQLRGGGLGTIFGSETSSFRTRRGFEKTLFQLTILLAVIFVGLAIANMVWEPTPTI